MLIWGNCRLCRPFHCDAAVPRMQDWESSFARQVLSQLHRIANIMKHVIHQKYPNLTHIIATTQYAPPFGRTCGAPPVCHSVRIISCQHVVATAWAQCRSLAPVVGCPSLSWLVATGHESSVANRRDVARHDLDGDGCLSRAEAILRMMSI